MPAPKPWASMEMTHAIKFAKNWFTKKFMFFQREKTGLTAIVPSGYKYSGGLFPCSSGEGTQYLPGIFSASIPSPSL